MAHLKFTKIYTDELNPPYKLFVKLVFSIKTAIILNCVRISDRPQQAQDVNAV